MSTTNDEQAKYIRLGTSTNGTFAPDQEAINAGFTFTLKNDMERKDYTGEQPKREPVLMDFYLEDRTHLTWPITKDGAEAQIEHKARAMTAREVRDFYENEITEGRLMVVKTAKATRSDYQEESWGYMTICECGGWKHGTMNFCPKCGAKIVE